MLLTIHGQFFTRMTLLVRVQKFDPHALPRSKNVIIARDIYARSPIWDDNCTEEDTLGAKWAN